MHYQVIDAMFLYSFNCGTISIFAQFNPIDTGHFLGIFNQKYKYIDDVIKKSNYDF